MKTPHYKTSKEQRKHKTSTGVISRSLLTGSIIALIIAATPYIFYSYRSFPDTKVWETFLFTYDSKFYGKVSVGMWTILGKFIPLLLLIIWFSTCRNWWYHVILIPIGMYLFQLIMVINDDIRYTDIVEIWYLIPIMAIIVPIVYLIRVKLFASIHDPNMEQFEKELGIRRGVWGQIKDLFR